MSMEDLVRYKEQLQLKKQNNSKTIKENDEEIANLALQSSTSVELVEGSGEIPGNGTEPINPHYQLASEVLSGLSATITSLGPAGEFIHNINDFVIKKNPIQPAAIGWPAFDMFSNIPYVCHLWVDYANHVETDLTTVQTNAAPSYVMISFDSIIIFTLAVIKIAQMVMAYNQERLPLLNPTSN